jgi:type I restriction enzyme M protein
VLPEGIFGNPSDRYVWEYLNKHSTITGVVSLAQEAFQPSTHTKTSVLFVEKSKQKNSTIFMAVASNIGHNKNGKPIYKNNGTLNDDIPQITSKLTQFFSGKRLSENNFGFVTDKKNIVDSIYIPEYYNPEINNVVKKIKSNKNYDLVKISDLIKQNVIQIRRGNEIGSEHYGSGDIPFVRTSDIVNWEIKVDPIKCVSEDVYNDYKVNQDVQEKDILFVSDGTFLIGRSAFVTKYDCKIIIQSHVRKIRVLDQKILNPYYLFYLLNTNFVRKQIDSKTFVQATISTLGNRIEEILLPISLDKSEITKISNEVRKIIDDKANLRTRTMKLTTNSI